MVSQKGNTKEVDSDLKSKIRKKIGGSYTTKQKKKIGSFDSLSTVNFPTPGIPVKLIINRLVMPNIPILKLILILCIDKFDLEHYKKFLK